MFEIVQDQPLLIIRDVGPWNMYPTVTNDIENVVKQLVKRKFLPTKGYKSFAYYDSDDKMTGVIVHDGEFAQFCFPRSK